MYQSLHGILISLRIIDLFKRYKINFYDGIYHYKNYYDIKIFRYFTSFKIIIKKILL